MSRLQRIGVLGGTFDPPHNAHCDIARAALDEWRLDRVLFVVAARPPHKSEGPYATPEERLAMVQAALAGEPRMEVCEIELERDGPSYTRDTLRELERLYPGADLFLIVGFDSLLDLPHWKDPQGILARARLLVVPRPGLPDAVPSNLDQGCDMLPFEKTTLSSTEVRKRIAAGEPFSNLVPHAVAKLIRRKGIYEVSMAVRQSPRAEEFIALLSERLSNETRRHSLSTAELMTSFAAQAGITHEQAVTTGLLHDLGKGMDEAELLEAAERYGIVPSELQRHVPKLLHGPVAAEECRRRLGIDDDAVYEAIYWHSTGRPGLGNVGLALYVSDFAEPARTFHEAAVARAILCEQGFAKAVRYATEQKLRRLGAKSSFVDPITEAFYAWLKGYGDIDR